MPLFHAAEGVAKRLPKVISPRGHAIADYLVAGSFFVFGALVWGRNKRAAIAAFGSGALATANSMLTDYPGGVAKLFDFETHCQNDMALAGLTAMKPTLLFFRDEPEAWFFRGQAVLETAIVGMTQISNSEARRAEPLLEETA
jgi:hypothetical protein